MSVINLEYLFKPKSVAVIGATNDPRNAGNIVMRNIMAGGFMGPVMPVSNQAEAIAGVLTHKSVKHLPKSPDLAIVCSPLDEVPEIIHSLKERGTRGAVLMGSGFASMSPEERLDIKSTILSIANTPDIRLIGPKSLGFMVPSLNLNASLAHSDLKPGKVAFISQSDSLFATVLDWARAKGIGFSHMIALGSRIDVSFADILDYLGSDPLTRSIMLYVESIKDAREFMSAARAASRNKPVLVIRPGQALDTVLADLKLKETGDHRLVDAVYDVAFRRAGMLRVENIDGLFDAAQTLGTPKAVYGKKLAILTNGTSAGILAADRLLAGGGELAELSDTTIEAIDNILGAESWSRSNPVDIPFNANGKAYSDVLKLLLKDKGSNGILVMHVPWTAQPDVEVAEALTESLKRVKRMVLTAWLGSGAADESREVFRKADIPTYDSPTHAVRAFLYMAEYLRNQELLIETPDSLPTDFFPDTNAARSIVAKALDEGRESLTEPEAKDILAAYGVPVVETRIAVSAKEAVIAADALGYPVALKLRSPQIPQPYDVGGVLLDLETPERVWEGAASILARCTRERPDAYIEGFTVQKMGRRPGAHELFISGNVDPVFGPVLSFGHGGMAREMIQDTALTLPPLSMSLAKELVGRTRIATLLEGTPSQLPADVDDICLTLIQISQLIVDVPQITSIDINPLYADSEGVLALGGKIAIAPFKGEGEARLAIRPYPRELEEIVSLKTGRKVTLRPIRPEDEDTHRAFLASLSDEDLRLRFFGVVQRDFDHKDIARFTQIDYDREMAFIASAPDEDGNLETLGVMRTNTKPDNTEAEFAIVVRSDQKGGGLGSLLFDKGIRYTKERGTKVLSGQTMIENKAMQGLSKKFGFVVTPDPHDEDLVEMILDMEKVGE
ncbi:bifunctional acetate--CoA ligase family protein/GNAT family N-acetyltransferase [Pseudodesulfovibrio sp. zrk46]|uniref:bifunctional acetate--CoA ligase family protein/GNAT family N-acetyltransferase n=1 Tax=Pseudodesulfovibrio sp. zrk46 TaxID=2725288 RepID=UPI00144940F3|nr:bifunctional acetate--CoA ligase family protein/GNAT family N-acetyltransferase [Pseudodesulfovibrio sp. zrk46]QJB56142.1 bifunctional acetate--CoA ligase family protein/GNAT family N-acetyltransferase [Pseudodesulfovibrio sp. zrk46]